MKKANTIAMWIAGLFLIVATVLKINQMLTEPIISEGFWESWEFFLIQIPLELGLGIWLVCGLFKKAGWLLGTVAYFGFIGVTLYKALIGAESCGCFGTIHVNPWITLTLVDIPIFLMLAIFRPKGEKLLPPPWPKAAHFFAIAIPTFILLPAIEYVLITNKQVKPTVDEWLTAAPSKLDVVIEPNELTMVNIDVNNNDVNNANVLTNQVIKPVEAAKLWPLLEYIDISDQLKAGLWVVLMYHNDCPDCTQAIPVYEEMQESLSGNDNSINFVFIEMPPYEVGEKQLLSPDSKVLKGQLSNKKKWFLQTPVVVILHDGVAVGAWEGVAPDLNTILDTAFGE